MAPLQKFFVVVLACVFLPSKITVDGSGKLCDSKTCLSLCCSSGKAQLDGICVEDNSTSLTFPWVKTSTDDNDAEEDVQRFHLLTDDPCAVNWMSSSILANFTVLENGSIYAKDFGGGMVFDFEHHCLFRKPESTIFLAKVCHPWIVKVYWQISCSIFAIFVMLAIVIIYGMVPELKNLHGMVFRSYVATYIVTHFSVLGQQLTADTNNYAYLFTFFVFSLHYTAGCCALWLNVMSFNIWRTFRGLRSFENNSKERDRRKFIMYAIYAWVTPAIYTMTTWLIMSYVAYFEKFALNKNLVLWCCAALLTTVIICNTFLYSATAIRIRQHKKDTANLASGVNKHHESEKQWFNLHVKLFMITGVHTIMWVIWELFPSPMNTSIMIVLEVVQCLLIFFIFIWKDNVKRSLRQRFDNTLCRLRSTFSTSHTTTATTGC